MTATIEKSPTRRGSRVVFDADVTLPMGVEAAWRELTDWGGHAEWIPMTKVDVDPDDPNRFIAWSGIGRRLALEDRMHATELQFDGTTGTCHVEKLGPVLVGFATLEVRGDDVSTRVLWHEDVHVPYLPGFLTGVVGKASAGMFAHALKRLGKTAR